jgi:Rod binding domain-containing protein
MVSAATGSSEAGLFQARQRPDLPLATAPTPAASAAEVARTRKLAQKLVGETFFGMMLKEMRKTLSKDHLLSGGHGEEIMQPQLDQVLTERMSESHNFTLADSIVQRIYHDQPPYSNLYTAAAVAARQNAPRQGQEKL